MRGKRSRQYRKLMQQYAMTFGLREPYMVLVDAQMIQDAERFKMDLVSGLERTLNGKVKPMITQCSIRQLYTLPSVPQPQKDSLIALAKSMERRRCNHHTLDNPLSTLECLSSVIDPKKAGINKAHVVVASQEEEVRRWCRGVRGVPLVYVKRSVMIMEPMAESSMNVREGIERGKFRTGLRGRGLGIGAKRKREEGGGDTERNEAEIAEDDDQREERALKKKRARGPKGPNPLSVKKSKREKADDERRDEDGASSNPKSAISKDKHDTEAEGSNVIEGPVDDLQNPPAKRKRKRKHKADKMKELGKELEAPQLENFAESD